MKKWIALIVSSAMLSTSLIGCASQSTPAEATSTSGVEEGAEGAEEAVEEDTDVGVEQQSASGEAATTPEVAEEHKSILTQENVNLIIGAWQDSMSQRAGLEITEGESEEDKDFCAMISWAGSYNEQMVWEMNLEFDPATGELAYDNGSKKRLKYNDDGTIAEEEIQWEGSEGAFTFDGSVLYWEDSKEEESPNLRFERYYAQEVSAEDYAVNVFDVVANLETGTAGSSLKAANTAQEVLTFAYENQIWNAEATARDAAIKEAWDSLSDVQKDLFKQNRDEIAELLDETFSDYESVKGTFEDAGVGEQMEGYSRNVYARRCWNTLRKAIMNLE